MEIGFIGLGSMGLPLARRLLEAGHRVAVYNRTPAAAERLAPFGAVAADSPAAAARGAEALVTMVADDAALEAVLEGERHAAAGQAYVAAPVFGRPDAAAAGKLWIVAAGPAAALERCRPLFEAMGQGVIPVGDDPARANVVKLAGNLLLAAAIEALGEAFVLARKHGIAPEDVLDVVNGRLFRSPIYENYGRLIAAQRYEPAGFRLRHGLKDVRLALEAGEAVAAPLPLASLVRDRFLSAVARGWGDADWAALARVAAADAGL